MDSKHDPYLPLLLLWRGVLALCALHLVIDRPFEIALIVALAVISMLIMLGEQVYRRSRYVAEERIRKQLARETRERRAEEARRRLEATAQAKQESQRQGMAFGLDDEPEPATASVAGAVSAMTTDEFDLAMLSGELAENGSKASRGLARGTASAR